MARLIIVLFILLIQLFPYVRVFLPQRDEEWLFKVTKKHGPVLKLIHEVLIAQNPYYFNLSPQGKRKFLRRVLYLILRKTVVGYQGLEVNLNMAILVLSAQVQLTFGMRRFSMPHFKKIILYPDVFYSRYFNQDVKGLTSGLGFINLSWRHSKEGYEDGEDNLNLLLHEFSHALMIELKKQLDVDYRIIKPVTSEKSEEIWQKANDFVRAVKRYLLGGTND